MTPGRPDGDPLGEWPDPRHLAIQQILRAGLAGTPEDLGDDYEAASWLLDMMLDAAPQPDHIIEFLAGHQLDPDLHRLRRVADHLLAWRANHPRSPRS